MTPKTIKDRVRGRVGGFTLVELMVVVMIIAILMAIAIPTFLNSRKRAQDSSAKSNLRTALSAAQSVYSENQTYADVTELSLAAEEPTLSFVATGVASAAPKTISIKVTATTAEQNVYLVAMSDSGKCFALRHSLVSAALPSGSFQAKDTAGACTATKVATDGVFTAL